MTIFVCFGQEITLGGHLYLQLLKDRLAHWLGILRLVILKKDRANRGKGFSLTEGKLMTTSLCFSFAVT